MKIENKIACWIFGIGIPLLVLFMIFIGPIINEDYEQNLRRGEERWQEERILRNSSEYKDYEAWCKTHCNGLFAPSRPTFEDWKRCKDKNMLK